MKTAIQTILSAEFGNFELGTLENGKFDINIIFLPMSMFWPLIGDNGTFMGSGENLDR